MSNCCQSSRNCGPPEWVINRMQAKMAAKHGFDKDTCCSNNNMPSPPSCLPPWENRCSRRNKSYGPPHHFFNHHKPSGCEERSNNTLLSSPSNRTSYINRCYNKNELSGPPSQLFNQFDPSGYEERLIEAPSCRRRPPFWLRNKWMTNKKDDSFGPRKTVIIEMLGLKRDYLNSKINSLDNHISKLKEEIKVNAVSKEKE